MQISGHLMWSKPAQNDDRPRAWEMDISTIDLLNKNYTKGVHNVPRNQKHGNVLPADRPQPTRHPWDVHISGIFLARALRLNHNFDHEFWKCIIFSTELLLWNMNNAVCQTKIQQGTHTVWWLTLINVMLLESKK